MKCKKIGAPNQSSTSILDKNTLSLKNIISLKFIRFSTKLNVTVVYHYVSSGSPSFNVFSAIFYNIYIFDIYIIFICYHS